MNASDLMVKCLENEGVKYIFGVPGEENEDFLFALEDSSLTFVPVRHEQGGAFMANVWGRLSGRAGVCLSTLGPGATNLVTGVADANLDKAPLVTITGQGSSSRLHHESHQIIDVVKMMEPISKWTNSINSYEIIPEVVRKAFKLAEKSVSQTLESEQISSITHLITVSCTGFYAPGLDMEIVKAYGLDPGVRRYHLGFMGCFGTETGFKMAV